MVADLQTANAPVKLPDQKSRRRPLAGGGWGIRAAIAAVLVLLGMGIGWGLYGSGYIQLGPDGAIKQINYPS